ncbi:hypothetical protein LJC49_07015 [Ruminococcaceae bacterium OttesenSCG-928-I18]|nr:hypothetical protein [Ruminococcaceae bacterium OttesenSCG-928-I18]
MDQRDAKQMVTLAKEGKQISKIWREDFPQYGYIDIYIEVYGQGEKSSLGVKRMISSRLKKLIHAAPEEQELLIDEIDELVGHLYERYKSNQKKLDMVRTVIDRDE